ncbi:hypothetical protein I7I51_05921 [Histoplasma capsulatum]|uniref:Uncharacterized protein n=1 Tax=Ajellomyces capsulatus TaxID=5037 RepID=A0A8A1MIX7_AJECA|nr:hypothetical protein I7I51_05921 [Histoplasma capsulatum]
MASSIRRDRTPYRQARYQGLVDGPSATLVCHWPTKATSKDLHPACQIKAGRRLHERFGLELAKLCYFHGRPSETAKPFAERLTSDEPKSLTNLMKIMNF